jgi:hypothetical protein
MRWKQREPHPTVYWKPWFAWHPVEIEDAKEIVWLEWIWRHVDRIGGGAGDYACWYRYRSDVSRASANNPLVPF